MAENIICLDITEDAITAVRVERQAKVLVIIQCHSVPLRNLTLEEGLDRLGKEVDLSRRGDSRLSLGSEFFSFRNLSLPFADRKKIRQVLPYELENFSAVEPAKLHMDFLVSGIVGEEADIIAAILEKEFFSGLLSTLNSVGFDPGSVEIRSGRVALHLADVLQGDCLFLDRYGSLIGLIFVRNGRIALVRTLSLESAEGKGEFDKGELFIRRLKQTLLGARLAQSEENAFTICFFGDSSDLDDALSRFADSIGVEVKKYCLTDQPLIKIDPSLRERYHGGIMDAAFSLAMKEKGKNTLFNFRRDEFRKMKGSVPFRGVTLKAGAFLLVTLAVAGAYLGYDYRITSGRQAVLKQQIVSIFKETLPQVKRVVNPVRQLQAEINNLKKTYKNKEFVSGYGIVPLLTEISARIPPSYPVVVKRMVIDTDMVRMNGTTIDFNTVDNIQKELEKSAYFRDVVISSASQATDGEGVRFELRLSLLYQDR
ncbi:PilN domain-containing protein [Desulfomarina sp.]